MTADLDDTQPRRPSYVDNTIPAPPRFLLWSVIGVFVLGVVGVIAGIFIFTNVLEPAYQQRVIDIVPFMQAFLPARPDADDTLPVPSSVNQQDISPDDLLAGMDINEATDTPEPTLEATSTQAETAIEEQASPPTATATVEVVQPTNTPEPTAQPTEVVQPTATTPPQDTSANPPTDTALTSTRSTTARMTGFRYEKQTWNNCGPANITMGLSYYGWQNDQTYAASYLKPGGREDKNVSPSEIVEFVNNQTGVRALTRMGGSLDLLKDFVANEIPVIIETGYKPEGYAWLGHYQTIIGYDDTIGVFWLYDTFIGTDEGITESYNYLDEHWKHFNRQFIIIYETEREDLVRRILGDYSDPQQAAEIALMTATEEATQDPSDGHAWFNMGTALNVLGDYERATVAFDKALATGLPWRMLWYQFGPYEAYYETGRYDDLLSLVSSNLSNGGEYVEETFYWQGLALAAKGETQNAASSLRTALNRNPSFTEAREALDSLDL